MSTRVTTWDNLRAQYSDAEIKSAINKLARNNDWVSVVHLAYTIPDDAPETERTYLTLKLEGYLKHVARGLDILHRGHSYHDSLTCRIRQLLGYKHYHRKTAIDKEIFPS